MVAFPGGAFGGALIPKLQTGKYYQPHWAGFNTNTSALTATANRLYRTWLRLDNGTAVAGGWFYNSGVGDNGKKVRVGIWDENGVLKKDFGESTLTAAAARRSLANAITLSAGWYQIGLVSDTTPALYSMYALDVISNVGDVPAPLPTAFGQFPGAPGSGIINNTPVGDYAAFTYGALPDPITTATATIFNDNGDTFPLMGIYL